MSVFINFKICDNSRDCSGITACPVKAFFWDEKKKTIAVDEKKCIGCGKCEKACPVGAIRVARTKKEYEKIKKAIENDPRQVSDLFVDRYGAEPIHPAFLIDQSKFDIQILRATQLAVVEFFSRESIKCLLKSIPIKELLAGFPKIKYRKIQVKIGDKLLAKYKIRQLPALVFFQDGQMIGKIEGYFDRNQKPELIHKVSNLLR